MTSLESVMLRLSERLLPPLMTPADSAQSVLDGRMSGRETCCGINNRKKDLHCSPRKGAPANQPENPDIIPLFKWEKSLIAMLMTFICENITNSLVYICVHL